MSDLLTSLTSAELKQLRIEMQQTPRSMAKLLNVSRPLYYQWERGGKVPVATSLAVRFLATQTLPSPPSLPQHLRRSSRDKYPPGTRLGRLVVLQIITPGQGNNLKAAVQCDCGVAKTWQVGMLRRYRQCSTASCPLSNEPMPPDSTPATTAALAPATTSTSDLDWEAGL